MLELYIYLCGCNCEAAQVTYTPYREGAEEWVVSDMSKGELLLRAGILFAFVLKVAAEDDANVSIPAVRAFQPYPTYVSKQMEGEEL